MLRTFMSMCISLRLLKKSIWKAQVWVPGQAVSRCFLSRKGVLNVSSNMLSGQLWIAALFPHFLMFRKASCNLHWFSFVTAVWSAEPPGYLAVLHCDWHRFAWDHRPGGFDIQIIINYERAAVMGFLSWLLPLQCSLKGSCL